MPTSHTASHIRAYHRALDLVAHMPDTAHGIYVDENYPIGPGEVPPMCLLGTLAAAMNLVEPSTACPTPEFWDSPEYKFARNAIEIATGPAFIGMTHYFDEFNYGVGSHHRQMTPEQLSDFFSALINDTPIPLPITHSTSILQYAD